MAKLNLYPIGSALNQQIPDPNILEKEALLEKKREEIKEGWGKAYQKRVLDKKKMTAHERIIALADDKNKILFINTFVNYGVHYGEENKICPNAGVITAFIKVHNRWTIV